MPHTSSPTRVHPVRIIAGLLLSLLLGSVPIPASGAPATEKAVRAMGEGDFKTALSELRPLAEKRDPNAQFLLGMLYDAGKAFPKTTPSPLWGTERRPRRINIQFSSTLEFSN